MLSDYIAGEYHSCQYRSMDKTFEGLQILGKVQYG